MVHFDHRVEYRKHRRFQVVVEVLAEVNLSPN